MEKLQIPFRVHSTGWLLLVFCLSLGVMIDGPRLGLFFGVMAVLSLLLHEAGHMLAAAFLGVPVREFGLRLAGAYIRRAYAATQQDEVLIATAGPLMNFCLILPLSFVPILGHQLALCNLALGLVNLLPIPSSDGMRILRALRSSVAPGPLNQN
ncbi:MAG TPA: site-2 protease family protein [Acidobacteriaceae bacterium]|jgi:Zn-dependent protease|nr:site-2 protease family protein [Acidobacteriaceae bacterium]